MTVPSNIPLDPRQATLAKEIVALTNALLDFREALRPVNDEVLNEAFREILDDADRIVGEHARRPNAYIADDMANLRSLFARRNIPREDPDLGKIPSLTALRSARGALLADFDSILGEARNLGLVPSDPRSNLPAGMEIERAGREGQFAALEQRLRRIERDLESKIVPEGQHDEGHSLQQIGLVNFYVEAMRIELLLAKLETKAKDLIDLAGLWRAIEALGELTADFSATVEGLREKVTNTLKQATRSLWPSVRRAVGGLRILLASVRRQAQRNVSRTNVVGDRFRDFAAAPQMIVVPAGDFMMGSPDGEDESDDRERPQHKVTIKTPFAVSTSPITRGEFAAFVNDKNHKIEPGAWVWNGQKWENDPSKSWRDPGFLQEDDHPVVCVNWHDARDYVAWLKERSGGRTYRLLSEAEWEYCCRAGTTTPYSTGDRITPAQANFGRNSKGTTSVTTFPFNRWGLRDMHGNVWEWCDDNWHEDYKGDPPLDGSAWPGGDTSLRVLRGGSWSGGPRVLRSAYRDWNQPDDRDDISGFRVARTL